MVRVLKIVFGLAVIFYFALLIVFYREQRKLLFFPSHSYTSPAASGANASFTEIAVTAEDGIALNAWFSPPTGKPCTVVFFHGNADNLATAAQVATPYIAEGYGFLLAEYRGYSGLPGTATEKGLYSDARADLQVLNSRGIDAQHIILFGHSLGTGVAVQMASENSVDGLMLLAPYLSIPKVAQVHYPFLPAQWMAKDRFDNQRKIRSVHAPLLIARGTDDEVVPPSHGDQLFALANQPKEFHSLQGKGHNDAFDAFSSVSLHWLAENCR
ncbi:MAG TPA: alpha/beta hydrolase [Terracidiphilus sp.]|jgi:fermentation-respiration switch protein FrsA (DUF1100 family)|nr:alpha/beta hydrolase [Terracidiphilus sp.]